MRTAESHRWTLQLDGDRRELAEAFRGSQWEDDWYNRSSPIEDDDPYSAVNVSLPFPDMNTLVEALKHVGHLRPLYGINLHCNADFGCFRVASSLCSTESGFAVSSCTMHHTAKSIKSEAMQKLADAEKSLGELRNLIAAKE